MDSHSYLWGTLVPLVRKKNHFTRQKKIRFGAIAAVALMVAALLGYLYVEQQNKISEDLASASEFTPNPVEVPSEAPAPEPLQLDVAPVDDVVAKLQDPAYNFVMTVVGDSTGFPAQGWVEQSARQIRAETGRTVAIHTWNNEAEGYDPARVFGDGEPSLTIWNGSAPGKTPEYSIEHLDAIMPERSDLVVVNHGHNIPSAMGATTSMRALLEALPLDGSTALMVMAQNPENVTGQRQQDVVQETTELVAQVPNVEVVDAFTAFQSADDLSALLEEDGIHPNEAGYRIWAELFTERLGFQFDPAVA